MTRIDEYERGKRDGIRQAVTWLYHRAQEMNDPHAVLILHCAADHLGQQRARDPKGNVLRKPRALAPLTK
jgi:L-ascorbate metabolism protein UlaG (beta-lactamase superfamily)